MSPLPPEDEAQLRERLRSLRVDPPPGDFAAALHRKLVEAGPPDPEPWWRRLFQARWSPALWPALGAAAGALVVIVVGLRQHNPTVPPTPPGMAQAATPATEVPASKVAIVRLNLTTEVAANNAEIRISLPEGLVFWSEGEALAQRSFTWTQALAAGDNAIPIAVRGERPGRYKVTVSARTGNEQVEDEVLLEVTSG